MSPTPNNAESNFATCWPANCQLAKNALRWAECSIMKAVGLPNSPATANPLQEASGENGDGCKQSDRGVGGHQRHDRGADTISWIESVSAALRPARSA